jgi:16S rRNA processing protein RimM
VLRLRDLTGADIREREAVFLEIDGMLVPFFIEAFQERSKGTVILRFEEIITESGAREFTGCPVYVRKDQVRKKESRETMPDLSGYRVEDVYHGFKGLAGAIAGNANNPLLEVHREERIFLVPLHEDIVREINHQKKVIMIEAPEGLFEL